MFIQVLSLGLAGLSGCWFGGGSIGGGSNEYFGSLGRVLQHLRSCQPPTSLVQSSCSGLYMTFRVEDPRKGLEWLLVFFSFRAPYSSYRFKPPPPPETRVQSFRPIFPFAGLGRSGTTSRSAGLPIQQPQLERSLQSLLG